MTTGRLATQCVLVLAAFVIPRLMGVETYGVFAAIFSILAILQMTSTLGLPLVEVRFLAPLWQSQQRDEALELGASIWTTRAIVSLFAGLLAYLWLVASPGLGLSLELCLLLGVLAALRYLYETCKNMLLPVGHVGKLSIFDFSRALLTLGLVAALFPTFGLSGAFVGLTALQAVLFVSSFWVLRRAFPLRLRDFRWSTLRPHLPFSLASHVGTISWMIQSQFSVYAVASWVSRSEAGFLGVTVQIYSTMQNVFMGARRSLMPILAEFEAAGEKDRLKQWGGLMMRYSAAGTCLLTVGWSLLGDEVVQLVLTDAFAPVYANAIIILVCAMFFLCADSCNAVLLIRGRAGLASGNIVVYAVATMLGVAVVTQGESVGTSFRIAVVYMLASMVFFVVAYLVLALLEGIWLPLRRSLLLMVPALLAWPASQWDAALPVELVTATLFVLLYGAGAVLLGLLPASELREILRHLPGRRSAGKTTAAGSLEPS